MILLYRMDLGTFTCGASFKDVLRFTNAKHVAILLDELVDTSPVLPSAISTAQVVKEIYPTFLIDLCMPAGDLRISEWQYIAICTAGGKLIDIFEAYLPGFGRHEHQQVRLGRFIKKREMISSSETILLKE